jgi:predicted NUDIX family NTP pyrophosphohydrolase
MTLRSAEEQQRNSGGHPAPARLLEEACGLDREDGLPSNKTSAGILMYRRREGGLQVLLVHPGGPFWAHKDDGVWSIPKGLYTAGESPIEAARREFAEETGCVPDGEPVDLGAFKQPSGKVVRAWALEGDFDLAGFESNTFTMEWPPRSGKVQEFPEADRAAWFSPGEALRKITKGQVPVIEALLTRLRGPI